MSLLREEVLMPQTVWTGSISFGLVNIPVRLHRATAPKDVRFHQFEGGTGRRIRYRRVASGSEAEPAGAAEEESRADTQRPAPSVEPSRNVPSIETQPEPEVAWEQVVKGYEIEPGRVVTVTSEELLSMAPERSRVLEVEEFIELREIDPVFFEKSYYVVPQSEASERPYSLLLRSMQASQKVAVGRFVLRTREHLAAIRPSEDVLMLQTLFYADEIRDVKGTWQPLVEEPPERELRLARQLIEALEGKWDPTRYRDTYRDRVLEHLRSKAGDAFVMPEPEEVAPSKAVDLMEALRRSVEATRLAQADRSDERKDRTG
jgi:DNA end-binding protein Ku